MPPINDTMHGVSSLSYFFLFLLFDSSDGQVYPHLPHDRCVHYSVFLILFGIIINRDYCFHYNVVIIIYQIYIAYPDLRNCIFINLLSTFRRTFGYNLLLLNQEFFQNVIGLHIKDNV